MTSKNRQAPALDEAYVWVWLPGATEPVVAGRVYRDGESLSFNYGRSYLERDDAIPLYLPELPLEAGAIPPDAGLSMAGCLRDGAPDAWGRRVILNRTFGIKGKDADIGALDFQKSPTEYVPRAAQA